jgi:hypothetical protein
MNAANPRKPRSSVIRSYLFNPIPTFTNRGICLVSSIVKQNVPLNKTLKFHILILIAFHNTVI